MPRRAPAIPLLLAALAIPGPVLAGGEEEARRAAQQFGRALTSADASALRPVLPARGKVQLRLTCLGPEEGAFGSSQVEALFRDFLLHGRVKSFQVSRLESDGRTYALVHGSAGLTDRAGEPCRAGLHLVVQPEDSRWVLREIKETRE